MKKRTKLILVVLNILLLAAVAVCLWKCEEYSHVLQSQQAAEVWAGNSGERFAQVSVFMPRGQEAGFDEIMSFRMDIDAELIGAGKTPEEGQTLWRDAWCSFGEARVTGEKETAQAEVLGVDGDFFLFHPYKLMSGSYIYSDDLMEDRVLLDRDLAWTLFGGFDLEGMSVTIDDRRFYIAGVVEREDDVFSKKTAGGQPVLFMPLKALEQLRGEARISCYELVAADPISGFVSRMAEEGFASRTPMVVENSARYDAESIWSLLKDFGERSIIQGGYSLPYWENAARVSQDYIAGLWAIMMILSILPLACFVLLFVKAISLLKAALRRAKEKLMQAKEEWHSRRYYSMKGKH